METVIALVSFIGLVAIWVVLPLRSSSEDVIS